MASTDKTTNFLLSQFRDSDKPSWRGDYNSDMLKLDAAVARATDEAGIAYRYGQETRAIAEEVQTDMTAATRSVETLNTDVNQAKADIQTLQDGHAALNTREAEHNTSLSNRINTVNSTLTARFAGYLTKGEAADLYEPKGWATNPRVVILGGENAAAWGGYYESQNSADVSIYSASGASIHNMGTVLSNATADATYNHAEVEIVMIAGGETDVYNGQEINTTTLAGRIDTIRSSFPGARVVFVPFCIANENDARLESFRQSLFARLNELETVATAKGTPLMSDSYIWLWKSTGYFSGHTLTSSGASAYAAQVKRWMSGDKNAPTYYVRTAGSATLNGSTSGLVVAEAHVVGAMCHLRFVYGVGGGVESGQWLQTLGASIRPANTFYVRGVLPGSNAERTILVQRDGQIINSSSAMSAQPGGLYLELDYPLV